MTNGKHKQTKPRRYALMLAGIWTIVIASLLAWSVIRQDDAVQEHARVQARMAIERDVFRRGWNAGYGSVYVPMTESTQPNPYGPRCGRRSGYPGMTCRSDWRRHRERNKR